VLSSCRATHNDKDDAEDGGQEEGRDERECQHDEQQDGSDDSDGLEHRLELLLEAAVGQPGLWNSYMRGYLTSRSRCRPGI